MSLLSASTGRHVYSDRSIPAKTSCSSRAVASSSTRTALGSSEEIEPRYSPREGSETERKTTPTKATEFEQAAKLLGGPKILRQRVRSQLEAHKLIEEGLPSKALLHLINNFSTLRLEDSLFPKVFGVGTRTVQRSKKSQKEGVSKRLNLAQSGRAWIFAEILAKATKVFGSQEEAEKWLEEWEKQAPA